VLAESAASGDLTVPGCRRWPRRLVLKARLLDETDKLLAEGPVPVVVDRDAPLPCAGASARPRSTCAC
jgi:hypothetical protein